METPDFDWPALTSESGDLPWDAITAAINLLAAQPHRWKEFLDPYNAAQADDDARNFLLLYIPFILGEAAARMPLDPPDGPRREIANFLLEELQLAYDCGNELSAQELEYACGRHGPAIVPLVLDRLASATLIDAPPAEMWDLLALAAESSDPALRQRVIAACHDLIETARTGHAELVDVIAAIGVLAALRSTASIAPIERFAHDRQEALVEHLLWNDVQAYLREIKGETPHDPDWWHRDPQDFLLTERTFWQDWFANCDASDASEEDVEFDTDDNDDPENSSTLADPDDPFAPDLLGDDDDFSDDTAEPFIPQTPIVNQSPKIGRNDPCPCGSGKKYKKCCGK